jgi:hypothetical protein
MNAKLLLGEKPRALFQIGSGCCKVVKEGMHENPTLGPDDGVFGEIVSFLCNSELPRKSFLEDNVATASVVARETTRIHIIEAYFLNILFQHHPDLAGRFIIDGVFETNESPGFIIIWHPL